jgi:fido (protein-threonine AMPylation protein)
MDGKTPLEADELDELLIRDINTREELNEYEQRNIEKAIVWTMGRTFSADQLLNDSFIRRLHKLMYGKVWSWAGKYRKTNKNIGIEKHLISQELRMAMDDCKFHIKMIHTRLMKLP